MLCTEFNVNIDQFPEQPFEPLADLPDYNIVGRGLLTLARSSLRDDSAALFYAADIDSVIDAKATLQEGGAFDDPVLVVPSLGVYSLHFPQ